MSAVEGAGVVGLAAADKGFLTTAGRSLFMGERSAGGGALRQHSTNIVTEARCRNEARTDRVFKKDDFKRRSSVSCLLANNSKL